MYKQHTHCRVCNSSLRKYIDLGSLPLSNNLCESPIEIPKRFPLQVMLCETCGLSQLSIVVDPNLLFGHYVYRSSINKGYVEHCNKMAVDLKARYGLTEKSFMVDVAGNDGALLREFKKEIGLDILNVDPAQNLCAICQATNIPSLNYFWSEETATRILNGFGKVDLITATNVFAHVDDVHGFMQGVKLLLKKNGVCILEFPYLIDFINNGEFDTIYFEHLSYFSIKPLYILCEKIGLQILDVEKQDIHGGSVRVHIGNGEVNIDNVFSFLHDEDFSFQHYTNFAEKAKQEIKEFHNEINYLKSKSNTIAAFAASAKGNTLLNCADIGRGTIKYIVDETPEKIGKYSPGTNIPIVSMVELQTAPPDYLVILSWNFKEEIIKKCRQAGYKGKFIIPIPEFTIID